MKPSVAVNIGNALQAIRGLDFVSDAKIVGSFAAGKKHYKDIDILIELKLNDSALRKTSAATRRNIVKILNKSDYKNLDLFLHTTDGYEWRLRPWVDDSLPKSKQKVNWEWEAWSDWPEQFRRSPVKPTVARCKVAHTHRQPQPSKLGKTVYSDKKGERLARKHHRGWRRLKYP